MPKRRAPASGPAPVMDAADYFASSMTEDDLQSSVEGEAKRCGWLVYHTHDSRHSSAGFPDLVMVRNGRIIFAELKSMAGVVSADQQRWLAELSEASLYGACDVYLWRPDDWHRGTIGRVLAPETGERR